MKTTIISSAVCVAISFCFSLEAQAQISATDSVFSHASGNRLSVGGYGEVALSRNFYSDSPFRYSTPKEHKNENHGRFDIPHAVIYIGYDFGKGWTMGSEIEFEHGGAGGAYEKEAEEGGEWEQETEKGGEVELEQFWIQKTFCKELNLRVGHIVIPVGMTNIKHEPLNFFTVYRPEGESTILPSTWHQTGISLWGHSGDFRYEVQMTSGLDAFMFNGTHWVGQGAQSPYEFEVANRYGFAARVDNYTIPGLRLGLSGYYGRSMHNTFPNEYQGTGKRYDKVKGSVYIGSFDFTYNAHNWIARGSVDYGFVSNASEINQAKKTQKTAPYKRDPFASHAVSMHIEAGYDIFSQIAKLREDKQKLYAFGHFEYYNTGLGGSKIYTSKKILAGGVNYYPVPQIAVKAEYHYRFIKSDRFNNEPAVNIGIAYEGFFL